MSASINRSLTTIKTELEFLLESEVISERLYDDIISKLPERYVKGMAMKDLNASTPSLAATNSHPTTPAAAASAAISRPPGPPPPLNRNNNDDNADYAEALYDYTPQQYDDLKLTKGDKIKILEKMSDSWWKGSANGQTGVFPANYVKLYASSSFNGNEKTVAAAAPPSNPPPSYSPPQQAPQFQQQQMPVAQTYYQQAPMQGYYQQPQPSTPSFNIPPQIPIQQAPVEQQPQQQQQEQGRASGAFKRFGSKLGDAAIFGAGATIGGDLVNSIF